MIAPEDRCDLCHEPAEIADSDLALLACCDAELWLHNRHQSPHRMRVRAAERPGQGGRVSTCPYASLSDRRPEAHDQKARLRYAD